MPSAATIQGDFVRLPANRSWSFDRPQDRPRAESFTHGYHRYPARFAPQLVERVLATYLPRQPRQAAVVADPFAGCGTTLVEAKLHGIASIGFDINPLAKLITDAKLHAFDPQRLRAFHRRFLRSLRAVRVRRRRLPPPLHGWFPSATLPRLLRLDEAIRRITEPRLRTFYQCGFSHMLPEASLWRAGSTRPVLDRRKAVADPFAAFSAHLEFMVKQNEQFHRYLAARGYLMVPAEMEVADARSLPLSERSVDLIMTSPPYATYYEYADLHQLSLLWFYPRINLAVWRKRFIGTSAVGSAREPLLPMAGAVVEQVTSAAAAAGGAIARYFADLRLAVREMYRVLKPRGRACLVIGNTVVHGVPVRNAEAMHELLAHAGFHPRAVVKRRVLMKTVPMRSRYADPRLGYSVSRQGRQVYEDEYLLVAQK